MCFETELQDRKDIHLLRLASLHANRHSGCQKVKVGSVIVDDFGQQFYGANRLVPSITCDKTECNKLLYDGKMHCVSTIHSEVDAIIRARRDLNGATIYVTRYPCENCARAIVTAGIREVVYGRPQPISDETAAIFRASGIDVRHVTAFAEEEGAVDN